ASRSCVVRLPKVVEDNQRDLVLSRDIRQLVQDAGLFLVIERCESRRGTLVRIEKNHRKFLFLDQIFEIVKKLRISEVESRRDKKYEPASLRLKKTNISQPIPNPSYWVFEHEVENFVFTGLESVQECLPGGNNRSHVQSEQRLAGLSHGREQNQVLERDHPGNYPRQRRAFPFIDIDGVELLPMFWRLEGAE